MLVLGTRYRIQTLVDQSNAFTALLLYCLQCFLNQCVYVMHVVTMNQIIST
jgi:hypothetical protein